MPRFPRNGPLDWLSKNRPDWTMRQFLEEFYVRRGMSSAQIAKMAGTGMRGWQLHVKKLGLTRDLSEARRLYWLSEHGRRIKDRAFRRVESRRKQSSRTYITPLERELLRLRSSGKCLICGEVLQKYLTRIHHVKAVVLGGAEDLSNLVALCYRCHDLVRLGDIDAVQTLSERFYRCSTCGQSVDRRRHLVLTESVKRTPVQFLVCSSCHAAGREQSSSIRKTLRELSDLSKL